MRKRLSDGPWHPRALNISIIGLLLILSFVFRVTYISGSYGVVDSEIPLVKVEVKDPQANAQKERARSYIKKITPVVVMTEEEFIFTDLNGITKELDDPRLRFSIPHLDGSPNIPGLLKTMAKWNHRRVSTNKFSADGTLILLPSSQIPMPIVIQTIHYLKKAEFISQVVLASGLT